MTANMTDFFRLSTAEEYLEFFGIPYDPEVVNVNRLHILKRFAGYMAEIDARDGDGVLPISERLPLYRVALIRAYNDLATGSSLDFRLFKVLKDHEPQGFVPLASLGEGGTGL